MAKPRMPREHGTNRGYGMHNRDKTVPCEPCFRAHAIWASGQRRALKCARGLGWPLLPGKEAAMASADTTGARFAASLLRLRLERGWRQQQLSAASGVSAPAISLIECRGTGPSLHIACALAEALETTVDAMTRRGDG